MEDNFDPAAVLDMLAAGTREEAAERLRAFLDAPDAALHVCYSIARALDLSTRTTEGRPPSEIAEPRPGAGDTTRAGFALERGLHAAWHLSRGDVPALIREARSAAAHAPGDFPWVEARVASLLQAAFRFTGDPELLAEAIAACTSVGNRLDAPRLAIVGRALLASLHMMSGRLHASVASADAALALAEASGFAESNEAAMAHQFRGYTLFEWNRLAEAEHALRYAWRVSTEDAGGTRSGVARVLAIRSAIAGDVEETERWLAALESIVHEPMTLRNREWLAAVRLTVSALLARNAPAARTVAPAGLREVEAWAATWSYDPEELAALTPGELRSRLGEVSQALALLELTSQWDTGIEVARLVRRCVGPVRTGFLLQAITVEAVALDSIGRPDEALQLWREALLLGSRAGYVRVYVSGSPTRIRLLRRAVEATGLGAANGTGAHARRVLQAAGLEPSADAAPSLTPRQREVLQLVADGASNKAIARHLGVSLPTVKTHVRDILRKTGAESRTHAVARAKATGIL